MRAGDLNGDGFWDVFVSAKDNDGGGTDAGRVYVFFGGASLMDTPATADDVTYTGEAAGDSFGVGVAGDG